MRPGNHGRRLDDHLRRIRPREIHAQRRATSHLTVDADASAASLDDAVDGGQAEPRAFADLLRQNDPAGLTPWLEAAAATDLGGFVTGLRQDEAAVRAAIVEPWSNGPVEGQVNRLKLIKRSMYGRAGFDLLRQRVLHAA